MRRALLVLILVILSALGVDVDSAAAPLRPLPPGKEAPGQRVTPPRGAPEPRTAFPTLQPPATGRGPRARVERIPDRVWKRMVGVSWSPGCTPRTSLRYLTVNYWGFDGQRYRGELIVNSDVGDLFAGLLTSLYRIRYPIRTMTLVDRFGPAPHGYPGANDYASMSADNTSAFNCRYAIGAEAEQRWSKHAYGRTIDINPWENPAAGGLPNWWYLRHRPATHPAVLTESSPATQEFLSRGWAWGGYWTGTVDYQHFERS
ncbi:MAG: M15 family metallopeptidase [Actinobacteria bacterium]|nr:M15 family metallopeptidase [Actinomycetota bacterium]